MDKDARQKLCEVIAAFGPDLYDYMRHCESLLWDHAPHYRREVNVLVGALKERVPTDYSLQDNDSEGRVPC